MTQGFSGGNNGNNKNPNNRSYGNNRSQSNAFDYVLKNLLNSQGVNNNLGDDLKFNEAFENRTQQFAQALRQDNELQRVLNTAINNWRSRKFDTVEKRINGVNVDIHNIQDLVDEVYHIINANTVRQRLNNNVPGFPAHLRGIQNSIQSGLNNITKRERQVQDDIESIQRHLSMADLRDSIQKGLERQKYYDAKKKSIKERIARDEEIRKQEAQLQAKILEEQKKLAEQEERKARAEQKERNKYLKNSIFKKSALYDGTYGKSRRFNKRTGKLIEDSTNLDDPNRHTYTMGNYRRLRNLGSSKLYSINPKTGAIYLKKQGDDRSLGSIYSGIKGHAGIDSQSQTDLINNLSGSSNLGSATKAKTKATMKSSPQVNSFQAQQRKAYDKQRQKAFLALLIPALKKILHKSPVMDLIKLSMLMLGKKHPVLAATGITALPIFGTVMANTLLGNPLGKIFGPMFKGSALLRPFKVASRYFRMGLRTFLKNMISSVKNIPTYLKGLHPIKAIKNFHPITGIKNGVRGVQNNIAAIRAFGFKDTLNALFDGAKNTLPKAQSLSTLRKGFSRVAPIAKTLGKKIPFVGALLSAGFEIPDLYKAKKEGRLKRQVVSSGLKIGGGLAGAALGGKAGVALGGALGSLVGPVGTAVGAVIGGIVGAVAGGIFGEKMATKIDNSLDSLCSIFKKFAAKMRSMFPWLFGNEKQKEVNTQKDVMKQAQKEAKTSAEQARKLQNDESVYIDELSRNKGSKTNRKVRGLYKRLTEQYKKEHQGKGPSEEELNKLYEAEIQKHKDKKKEYEEQEKLAREKEKSAESMLKALDNKSAAIDAKDTLGALGTVKASDMLSANQLKKGTGLSPQQVADFAKNSSAYEAVKAKKGYWNISNADFAKYSGNQGGSAKNGDVLYNQRGSQDQLANLMDKGFLPKGATITSALRSGKSGHEGHASGVEYDITYGSASEQAKALEGLKRAKKAGLVDKYIDEYTNPSRNSTGGHFHIKLKNLATGKGPVDSQLQTNLKESTETNATLPERSNVVSGSDIWEAVKAHTSGNTNSRTDNVRNLIFSSTDVTGSLGVWGITHLNNTGAKRGA